jgi:glycosyltransferase involved in cell wall biosynthesis
VLLVSPRLPKDNPQRCGDHTYTDTLLEYPPAGVRYLHYEDLIAEKKARRIPHLHSLGYRLTQVGLLPPDMWAEYITVSEKIDIVHIYAFSAVVRLSSHADEVPTIIGVSTNSYSDLKYYHEWDDRRIKRARALKRAFLRIVGAHDSSLRPENAKYVLTWSNFARELHLHEGFVRPEQIVTVYPGLPNQPAALLRNDVRDVVTFLFVGRDFERKNGPMVLDAFRLVHSEFPNTRMVVVGQPANKRIIAEAGVTHHCFMPRAELMRNVFPTANVLLLPSKAEGFGMAIVEAMSHGVPTIAVDSWAMPEIIRHGENGFLIQPNSVIELTNHMRHIAMRPELVSSMRHSCLRTFESQFAIKVHNNNLGYIYDQILCNDRLHKVSRDSNWGSLDSKVGRP